MRGDRKGWKGECKVSETLDSVGDIAFDHLSRSPTSSQLSGEVAKLPMLSSTPTHHPLLIPAISIRVSPPRACCSLSAAVYSPNDVGSVTSP